MNMSELITTDVLTDAGKIDRFLAENGEEQPSLETSLSMIRSVDAELFAQRSEDVWGTTAGSKETTLVSKFRATVEKLEDARNEASAWTGDTEDAFHKALEKVRKPLKDLESKAGEVGSALQDISDAWSKSIMGWVAEICSIVGMIVGIIGVVVTIATGLSGIGAVVGLVVGVIGVIISIAGYIASEQDGKNDKLEALQEAMAAMKS